MHSANNKQFLQGIFAETAKGNGRPFVDALEECVKWRIIGTTSWSRTYQGKLAVMTELLGPLSEQLGNSNRILAHHFIAEDDYVVVQARGCNVTNLGCAYENSYCWVFRLTGGKIVEVVEYADTALMESALRPPAQGQQPPETPRTLPM
jgi:ketosteroid isomerase-like protein